MTPTWLHIFYLGEKKNNEEGCSQSTFKMDDFEPERIANEVGGV